MANSSRWYKLDNAAKIVPSQAHGADTRVFRLTAVLKEDVNKELLEQALQEVAPEFYSIFKKFIGGSRKLPRKYLTD